MVDAFCVYHHCIISITKRLLFAILFIKLSYLSAIYDKLYGCMIYRHIPLFALQTRHITPRRKNTSMGAFFYSACSTPTHKQITSQKTGYFFCRRWDSNPHAFDGGGFWVRCVCQFRHFGLCNSWLLYLLYAYYYTLSRKIFFFF